MSEIPERMRQQVYDLAGGRCECMDVGCDHPVGFAENRYPAGLLGGMRCTTTFPYRRTPDLSSSLLSVALARPEWHCDHKIRRSDGGPTEVSNLQALCVPCHEEKTRRENS